MPRQRGRTAARAAAPGGDPLSRWRTEGRAAPARRRSTSRAPDVCSPGFRRFRDAAVGVAARAGPLPSRGYSRRAGSRAGRANAPMPNSSTILLDDEDSIQTLLTYPLERDGYQVVQARDGEEALRRFGEEDVDLVVLDIMLPRLDGLEVCKRLRSQSNVPIIMLTARGE